jgi:hypothetical protein
MWKAERDAEVQVLRRQWVDALVRVAAETVGSDAWMSARDVEREAAGRYTRLLAEPIHADPADPEATSAL